LQPGVNTPIRELLRAHGLRTSLFRLKVLNALVLAVREGRSIDVRGVQGCLGRSCVEISLVSVREVLKRLAEEGVVELKDDNACRFTLQALAALEPCLDQG